MIFRNSMVIHLVRFAVAACACLLLSCAGGETGNPLISGGETGNPSITGKLAYEDGTPAVGAKVLLRQSDYAATTGAPAKQTGTLSAIDSGGTDDNGFFSLDSVPAGSYIAQGLDDSNNGVIIKFDILLDYAAKDLGENTMKPLGRIRGRITLSEGDDPRTMQIIVFGVHKVALPDANGNFVIDSLPEGIYKLRVIPSLDDYEVLDLTDVRVISGETTELGDVQFQFMGIPSASGLTAVYDTLAGQVTLSWQRAKGNNVAGYIIFRNSSGSMTPTRISGDNPVTDTTFVDRIFLSASDTNTYLYVYRLKTMDKELNLSPKFSQSVLVFAVSPAKVHTKIRFEFLIHSLSINDSLRLVAHYQNQTRINQTITWRVDAIKEPVRIFADSLRTGSDTLVYAWPDAGVHNVHLEVMDAAGTVWRQTTKVHIVLDLPVCLAGPDTTVSINDSCYLRYNGTDRLGRIVRYRFDSNNDGIFEDSAASAGELTYVAPPNPGSYGMVVQAQDDDGNRTNDTIKLQVVLDPPTLQVGSDTTVSINDPYVVSFTGSDKYGQVVQYRFDIKGDGVFEDSSGSSGHKTYVAPPAASSFNVVVQAIDDDGNKSCDTVSIQVITDPPNVNAGTDTVVSVQDGFSVKPTITQQFGSVVKIRYDLGGNGIFDDSAKVPDPMHFNAPKTAGDLLVVVQAEDDDGNLSSDTMVVHAISDPPKVNAGADTTVSIGDVFLVAPSATQQFGSITKYLFDSNGDGVYDDSSSNADPKNFVAPSTAQDVVVIVGAVDDDGNYATDTMTVHVLLDPPLAQLQGPESADRGQKIDLTAHGSVDIYGKVVKYEWSMDGNGTFVSTTNPEYSFYAPDSILHELTTVLRVTDDDGQVGVDTFKVMIGIFREIGTALLITPSDSFYSQIAFKNGNWRIGGKKLERIDPITGLRYYTYHSQISFSEYGFNWTHSANAPFPGRALPKLFVFGDRLWVIGGRYSTLDDTSTIYLTDAWNSADGQNWSKVADSVKTSGPKNPVEFVQLTGAMPQFDQKIWLYTYTDIWYSMDGVNWTHWGARPSILEGAYPSLTEFEVHEDELWIWKSGNWIAKTAAALYRSSDGVTWSQVMAALPVTPFRCTNAFASFEGSLWLIGGHNVNSFTIRYEDVWISTDGINWTDITNSSRLRTAGNGSDFARANADVVNNSLVVIDHISGNNHRIVRLK